MSAPYKVTPVFDDDSLPAGLRRVHSTKAGTWGVIRLLEGRLQLAFPDSGESFVLTPDLPGLVAPQEPHLVEPLEPFRMQVEFHRAPPAIPAARAARAASSA